MRCTRIIIAEKVKIIGGCTHPSDKFVIPESDFSDKRSESLKNRDVWNPLQRILDTRHLKKCRVAKADGALRMNAKPHHADKRKPQPLYWHTEVGDSKAMTTAPCCSL
jgi:hypothetical protein